MTRILHGLPHSHNTRKVLAVAHHLGMPITIRQVNILAKESFTPEFMAINPNGLTPVLVEDGLVLWESGAILIHLASTATDRSLWPEGRERIEVLRWLFWNAAHWDHATDPIFIEQVVKGLEGKGAPDDAVLEKAHMSVARFAAVIEGALVKTPWLAGDALSLADFAVASCLQYRQLVDYRLSGFPNLLVWLDCVEALPAWRATEPDWAAL